MRLILTKVFASMGKISFFETIGDDVVPYAILSHTWDGEEVTYQDVKDPTKGYECKRGYAKLREFLLKSSTFGFSYAWIDTCCIGMSI